MEDPTAHPFTAGQYRGSVQPSPEPDPEGTAEVPERTAEVPERTAEVAEGAAEGAEGAEGAAEVLEGAAEVAESTDEVAEGADPLRFNSWMKRSATGAVITGIALGLQHALERERVQPAFVMEAPGEPDDPDEPITLHFDPDDPTKTVAVVRTRPQAEGERT